MINSVSYRLRVKSNDESLAVFQKGSGILISSKTKYGHAIRTVHSGPSVAQE